MATKQQIPLLAGSIVSKQEGFTELPDEDAQWVIENPALAIQLFVDAVVRRKDRQELLGAPKQTIPAPLTEQLGMWRDFYTCYGPHFGFADAGALEPALPTAAEGFGWLVVVKKGLTHNAVLETMRSRIKVYSEIGDDLDNVILTNERTAEAGDYAILVRGRAEPDEEPNTQAKQIAKKKIPTMTLLERLLLELFYFHFAHEHLDVKDWTLCSGSRDEDGEVPHVGWSAESCRFYIRRSGPESSRSGVRARVVRVAG